MQWVYDDGGRALSGRKGEAGDCVTRAIAIALERPYAEVYADLFAGIKIMESGKKVRRGRRGTTPRNGVNASVYRTYMAFAGWRWVATMGIGTGCQVHLRADELPKGRLIVRLSKHVAAVIDGVIHDTYDCSRDGTRCVYGYFQK